MADATTPPNVVVTGGSSGLGAAVARAVVDAGGTALVLDRQAPDAEHPFVQVDLADGAATAAACAEAARQLGRVDGLVCAAGIDACGTLDEVPADAWERVVEVNLLGTARAVRGLLPALRDSHGRVVTIASTLGLRALSDATAYCASKFGVVGFTRALTLELAGQVGVTLVVPGGMQTHFFDDRTEQYRPGPDAKLNDPANVAAAIVFALRQPEGCEVRELIITPSLEPSWP